MEKTSSIGLPITLRLIDGSSGHSIQEWRFPSVVAISVGRDPECDVAISDPFVSRRHAEFQLRGSQWWLLSHGRHGVLVEGQAVSEIPVQEGLILRLGNNGPFLQFLIAPPPDQKNQATAEGFDLQEMVRLHLDETCLNREVTDIAQGDYFQQLKQLANEFRQNRPH